MAKAQATRLGALVFVLTLCMACAAPTPEPNTVYLHLDGSDRTLQTEAKTVRAVLAEQAITLGPLDQIEPPLWTPVTGDLHIRIVRGSEETEYETIPYKERTIRDEFLAPSERQTLQEGADGQVALRYLVLRDGPQIIERRLLERDTVSAPVTAVYVEGSRGLLPQVAVQGTLAYLSNGEPWVLRRNTDQKRPLARGVQADGRVLDLSPDGRWLLYSAQGTEEAASLNELYVIDTEVLNTHPQSLGITNVLWAAWAPDGQRLAYATLTPIAGVPGWRATNDLHVIAWPGGQSVFEAAPAPAFIYAWYGERWLWRPDGTALAYARPDGVGLLDLSTAQRTPLVSFVAGATGEESVFLPALAWLPDGRQLLYTQPAAAQSLANLWQLDLSTHETRQVAADISGLALAPTGRRLAYVQPDDAEGTLVLFDLATAAARPLQAETPASLPPQLTWGPVETQFVYVHDGDLYRYDLDKEQSMALTATGLASNPVWR